MSQSHHAFRQKRQDHSPDSGTRKDTAPFEEVKEDLGASRNKRSTPSANSTLFQSDPEENVRLWMQKYFPGVTLSREEAIRQWLARPPEFRVQIFSDAPANGQRTGKTDIPAAVTRDETSEVRSSQRTHEDSNHHSDQIPQTIPIGAYGIQSDRSRKLPRLFFRVAALSVLAFVIIKLLWAIPMTHVFSRADSSIPASKSRNADSVPAATVPVSSAREENAQRSDTATQPSRIENVSIGCKDTQPCLEISTLGRETVPTLSTLTGPDRLVIDFKDVTYSSDIHRIPVGRGAVKSVRIGGPTQGRPPSTRVVIDLTAKCDYELHTLTNRFVLNIYPNGKPR
jgi:AMIN domain